MTMEFLLSDWLFDSYNLYGPHLDCVTSFKNEAKIGKIGLDLLYICTTTGATAKRMAPVDSAHQIGLATLLNDVLTVDEGVSGWRLKIAKSDTLFTIPPQPGPVHPNGQRY